MTCQSLQSVATYLKFDWNQPAAVPQAVPGPDVRLPGQAGHRRADRVVHPAVPVRQLDPAGVRLRRLGRAAAARRGQGRRVRRLPGRDAGAAAGLPGAAAGGPGARRRLDPAATRTPRRRRSSCPTWPATRTRPDDLAHALHEFVTIERHVDAGRLEAHPARPARAAGADGRVPARPLLRGRPGAGGRRAGPGEPAAAPQEAEEYEAAFRAAHPDAGRVELDKDQTDEASWSPEGLRVRLRLEAEGLDCDLDDALTLTNIRAGDRLVLYPRWAADERLPEAERTPFTPTPKQMLYGHRAELKRIVTARDDESRRIVAGSVPRSSSPAPAGAAGRGASSSASIHRPLEDGQLYTLDPCPNELVRLLVPPGGRWPVRRRAERPPTTGWISPPVAADGGRLAGPGPRSWRAWMPSTPPGTAPRLRGGQAGLHRRPRPDPDPAGAGAARHGQDATRPPSPSSPASRRRWRRAGTSGSSSAARPTPPPTC